MGVPVPTPVYNAPSLYIPPEDILTLEWAKETFNTPHSRSSSSSSSRTTSMSSSDYDEEEVSSPLQSSQPLSPLEDTDTIVGRQPDELVRNLMIKTFIDFGRLSHYYRVLSYFPRFMERYQNSSFDIVKSPKGPLRISDRYYIGIMAASQYKCQYLVSQLKNDFVLHSGDVQWLDGLQYTPVKIKKLAQINSILAHQPWLLRTEHIGALIRGTNPLDNWAVSEVVHIILVLCTFHSLSSFVMSCGIVPEYDCLGGYGEETSTMTTMETSVGFMDSSEQLAAGLGVTFVNATTITESITTVVQSNIESTIIENNSTTEVELSTTEVETVTEEVEMITPIPNEAIANENDSNNESECTSGNENCEGENNDESSPIKESSPQSLSSSVNKEEPPNISHTDDFSIYLDPAFEIAHEDFSFNSKEYSPLILQDYSWDFHGIAMVNKFLPSVGEKLNDEFSEIKDITDYCLFHTQNSSINDVSSLRQAIWAYVQRLSGLAQDDYIYEELESHLNDEDFKNYIKKVCTVPECITHEDWKNVKYQRTEEKCHINLIVVEARKQSELLHGLWKVMTWNERRT